IGIPNGTAPTTSPANGIQIGSNDVDASSELYVRDEAGNVVYLSNLTNRRFIAFDATALYPHATNGPDYLLSNGQVELYSYAVGDTGYFRASLANYTSIDSIWIEGQASSPASDSVKNTVYWRGVQSGDVETAAFASSATAEIDMGSTTNGIIRFRYTSSLNTGLAANDDVTWAVVRVAATANEMADTFDLRRVVVWYH
ncbi:MAG: hypothetical protein L0287_04510, partial [Anaerolineae bacterium]|nr:hypothetical protein [Anaerolineae bacterium]